MKTKLQRVNGSQLGLANAISIGLFTSVLVPIFVLVSIFGGKDSKYLWIAGIFIPVLYFLFSYLITRIYIWLFNSAVRWIKGIELELETQESIDIKKQEQ